MAGLLPYLKVVTSSKKCNSLFKHKEATITLVRRAWAIPLSIESYLNHQN